MTEPQAVIPDYLDERQLAQRTPFSRSQWQHWRANGGGPPWRKIGRRCVYKWSDVAAWIEKQPAVVK